MKETEIRSSELRASDKYEEPGMWPVEVTEVQMHGDTVLIWGKDDLGDVETTLDRDTMVTLLDRKAT